MPCLDLMARPVKQDLIKSYIQVFNRVNNDQKTVISEKTFMRQRRINTPEACKNAVMRCS